jgi:acetoin utilization deacetylase AcuC-like enzyme
VATGIVDDDRFQLHDTGPHHPENAGRVTAVRAALAREAWREQLIAIAALPAELSVIESTHRSDYIRRAESACRAGAPFLDTRDVTVSAQSFDTALLAAGAPLALADAIVAGRIDNGFALVRPPGHHAEHAAAMGFCLFNNVAILARYLQRRYGVDKVAIVDWDVHHGNGTQHTFEEDPSVLFISTHQYPYYPGSGAAYETGSGRGRGATLNCPMPAGATDSAYEWAFSTQILPALSAFKPEWIIVSAGFDAHRDDPLADIALTTACFAWMTARLREVAAEWANGRIISVLEGGYNLERLGDCVATHVAGLMLPL